MTKIYYQGVKCSGAQNRIKNREMRLGRFTSNFITVILNQHLTLMTVRIKWLYQFIFEYVSFNKSRHVCEWVIDLQTKEMVQVVNWAPCTQ